jgi:hypothetical protein
MGSREWGNITIQITDRGIPQYTGMTMRLATVTVRRWCWLWVLRSREGIPRRINCMRCVPQKPNLMLLWEVHLT